MADEGRQDAAQREKRAYEAHRVACFSNPHPAHQLQHDNEQGAADQTPGTQHHPPISPPPAQPLLSTLFGVPQRSSTPTPDTDRVIIHIDADAFYAQCEEVRDPSLKTRPLGVCVGGGGLGVL